jgi:hypothetical protein
VQRAQQGNQLRPLTGRQAKRTNRGIQIRIGTAATVVERDDRLERAEAAVVHVGRGESDIPQARRLEAAAILRQSGDLEAADIASPADSGVVEILIGEERTSMAAAAPRPAREERIAAARRRGERCLVTSDETIEKAAARERTADEGRDRLHEPIARDRRCKGGIERCGIRCALRQALRGNLDGKAEVLLT